jgi:predicted nucleic acid-binding protein
MSDSPGHVVIDSSVIVKWFLAAAEADVPAAARLRRQHADGSTVLAAPSHVVLEVLNALRFRRSSTSALSTAAGELLAMGLDLTAVELLAERAAVIAVEHDLTVYDAAFVALAESLDCELVTADRRLAACTACRTRLLGS